MQASIHTQRGASAFIPFSFCLLPFSLLHTIPFLVVLGCLFSCISVFLPVSLLFLPVSTCLIPTSISMPFLWGGWAFFFWVGGFFGWSFLLLYARTPLCGAGGRRVSFVVSIVSFVGNGSVDGCGVEKEFSSYTYLRRGSAGGSYI
ncbi:uncharacterized protein K452DRAFT_128595 [Aplosporella prunicola CBS 121167]|uniref:Uncharacterized protein n=1 Tax=Aplosporella prunicola CBS 121167 TaxID=1176127 RepID=A0A6A6AY95_9PEZI|nr:uncharacterized protein K452DRAFT_128595 [Aplosporella prunicola CBS 121167]KAF2136576.1 hypothetical protein K452DRAFT_128595 [Aplosporella prunicola CBS 121167]